MRSRCYLLAALFAVGCLGTLASAPASLSGPQEGSGFVAHEWGTFTTVAGPDGKATEWYPLGGPTDLPCFVETFANREVKVGFRGTVRMETPVIYFYGATARDYSVRVDFPQGMFTEWFPHATVSQPAGAMAVSRVVTGTGTITWPTVSLVPDSRRSFPRIDGSSHYYAARETDAVPLRVGDQHEKFLFYRGVASFPVPLTAAVNNTGQLLVGRTGSGTLGSVLVFTNRGGAVGYRLIENVTSGNAYDLPALDRRMSDLRNDLTMMLVARGLYVREAEAMVNTWRDSWFEEGTRVFYIVPPEAVDTILPLTIEPRPASVTRVFVGRMDVVTPATLSDARRAFAQRDDAALLRFGRLLPVVAERLISTMPVATEHAAVRSQLTAIWNRLVPKAECE